MAQVCKHAGKDDPECKQDDRRAPGRPSSFLVGGCGLEHSPPATGKPAPRMASEELLGKVSEGLVSGYIPLTFTAP